MIVISKKEIKIIESKTMNLIDLIQYQKDAVVSKTIIDKESVTLTLFAFDKEQGLSEHIAPFDAFVHVLDGEVEVKISGESFLLKKDELILMPANKPHALRAKKCFKMLLLMIKS